MNVDIKKLSADVAGELLRDLSFKDEYEIFSNREYKKLGCYSVFETKKEWKKVPASKDLFPILLELLGADSVTEFYKHETENIYMSWHWEGDGTLLFLIDDMVLVNSDCKKQQNWIWLEK